MAPRFRDLFSWLGRSSSECRRGTELEARMGAECTVIGTYAIRPFHNQKGEKFREWPVVVLADDEVVLLESFWDESKKHSPETIARFEAKTVRAKGMLHGEPPGSVANIAIPCISPVDKLEIVA